MIKCTIKYDFIKVNFKNGETVILNKSNVAIHRKGKDRYFVSDISFRLSQLACIIGNGINNGACLETANILFWQTLEVTRAEYERICKELGVEL